MNMEKALTKLISAVKTAKKMDEAMREAGYENNPYFDIWGDIAEAVYALLDEHTDTFDSSVTAQVISDMANVPINEAVDILWAVFKRKELLSEDKRG